MHAHVAHRIRKAEHMGVGNRFHQGFHRRSTNLGMVQNTR